MDGFSMLKLLYIWLLTVVTGCAGHRAAGSSVRQGSTDSSSRQGIDSSSHQVIDSSLQQGIEGTVFLKAGNRMPAPNRKPSDPKDGIRATVYIYELTNISQVDRVGETPYYQAIHTRLVRQAGTDDKGHFKVLLPAGHYSLFTKKDTLFYASRRDEYNNLAPTEVLPGKMTKIDCSVESDHKPVY